PPPPSAGSSHPSRSPGKPRSAHPAVPAGARRASASAVPPMASGTASRCGSPSPATPRPSTPAPVEAGPADESPATSGRRSGLAPPHRLLPIRDHAITLLDVHRTRPPIAAHLLSAEPGQFPPPLVGEHRTPRAIGLEHPDGRHIHKGPEPRFTRRGQSPRTLQ